MSLHRNLFGGRSSSVGRKERPRKHSIDSDSVEDPSLNVLPELIEIVRKLLPQEFPLNILVREVEYSENGCARLEGTLYMTMFRLIFAPENELTDKHLAPSGNRYIGEYDIPLTSILRIDALPVTSRSVFKSFLNENQTQSETRAFTIITRDFRLITFSQCSVTKSNSFNHKQQLPISRMETYINTLRLQCNFQDKEQLYPYLITRKPSPNNLSTRFRSGPSLRSFSGRSLDDDPADFCISNDERIKNYVITQDWNDELDEANEKQWQVDRRKFDEGCIARGEGPFVRLTSTEDSGSYDDLIWHWTQTSEVEIDSYHRKIRKRAQFMLVTVPGLGDIAVIGDPLRRTSTESGFPYTVHSIYDQSFRRYNLTKYPCALKSLQTSYEKLIEICVITSEDDDDKWFTKLSACKWLKYVSRALHGAASLAKLLNYTHIQLSGSDTDNSCLMSSLVQIFLRPKCRTIKGFCELIVREWLVGCHPFRERFGQARCEMDTSSTQQSPVFLLFLDCVHQLVVQNPFAFEFTDDLLLQLYYDICYCYQHTFVFNSVRERLNAIHSFPRNLLMISAFDFSLYLSPESCRRLKNDASVFSSQKLLSPRPRSASPKVKTSQRIAYRLETPKASNFTLDTSSTINRSLPLSSESFEYDNMEAPQEFHSNLHVDWRLFNLVLWSKCYCRYDQNYTSSLTNDQLVSKINRLQEDIGNITRKSRRQMPIDSLHSTHHANSWHPQALDTRV